MIIKKTIHLIDPINCLMIIKKAIYLIDTVIVVCLLIFNYFLIFFAG